MKYIVAEFIPIIIIFLLLSRFKDVVKFSHTILGKLLAIFVIVVYSLMDKWYGLLVCGIVIFYYQLFAVEGMTTYTMNDIQHETSTTENNDIFVKEFQQEHCEQGSLKYKDMDVKSEMAEHVFPEIDYKNDYKKCNPCDSACHYSIVAKKMISEDNMIKSRNSKDDLSWYHQIFGQSTNPMGAIGVVSEPFSIYS